MFLKPGISGVILRQKPINGAKSPFSPSLLSLVLGKYKQNHIHVVHVFENLYYAIWPKNSSGSRFENISDVLLLSGCHA